MFMSFNIGVSSSDPAWAAVAITRYWTQITVCTFHCESIIARGSCAARATLSRHSRGCTRRCSRTGSTGRSTDRSRRCGARTSRVRLQSHRDRRGDLRYRRSARFPSRHIVNYNHGLNNGSSQSSHGGGVLVMPDTRNHHQNAGACDSSREGWTGAKFGMKIWICIGGSCLGHLQTKTMSTMNAEKQVLSNNTNMNEEK
jgi:hypothetical protein